MKAKLLFLCCVFLILLCLASCEQTFETGSLTVSMDGSGAKNISPAFAEITIDTIEISGVLSTDSTKTFSKKCPVANSVTVEDLIVGTWNVMVKGYNSNETLIAESSSAEATISQDQATEVKLNLKYITYGEGSSQIKINWSKNIDQIDRIQIKIGDNSTGTFGGDYFTLIDNTYQFSFTNTLIPAGQLGLEIKALDSNNNQVGMSIEEKIDIYKGLTSVYEVTLDEGLYPPNTPAFSVESGEVEPNKEVAISTQTNGAVIYFTTDGSDPVTSDTKTLYSTPIGLSQTTIIKAVAVLNGRFYSKVVSGLYTVPRSDDYQILKTNLELRELKEVLYLKNTSITESKAVSWKMDGEDKTGEVSLDKGDHLITATIPNGDTDLFVTSILTLETSEQVRLSGKLNERSKTGLEMVNVLVSETTFTGSGIAGAFIEDRSVTLSPYAIGKYEVTQELYEQVMGFNPSHHQGDKLPASGETQELRPVEQVSWYSAVEFCNELTKLTMSEEDCVYDITSICRYNDDPNSSIFSAQVTLKEAKLGENTSLKGYRLPTEAEWECAARGGDPKDETNWNYDYSGSDLVEDVAWTHSNSILPGGDLATTHEVGRKDANSLGIFDMTGNVSELCWDGYLNFLEKVWAVNPVGLVELEVPRIRRGGNVGTTMQVKDRYSGSQNSMGDVLGFRICRNL